MTNPKKEHNVNQTTRFSGSELHSILCVNEMVKTERVPFMLSLTHAQCIVEALVRPERQSKIGPDANNPRAAIFRIHSPNHMKLRDKALQRILGCRHLYVAHQIDTIGTYWQSATFTFLCKQNLEPNIQAITWHLALAQFQCLSSIGTSRQAPFQQFPCLLWWMVKELIRHWHTSANLPSHHS